MSDTSCLFERDHNAEISYTHLSYRTVAARGSPWIKASSPKAPPLLYSATLISGDPAEFVFRSRFLPCTFKDTQLFSFSAVVSVTILITACTKARLGSHISSCCIYSHASAYQLANLQYPSAAFAISRICQSKCIHTQKQISYQEASRARHLRNRNRECSSSHLHRPA